MSRSHELQDSPSRIVSLNIRHGGGERVAALVTYLSGTGAEILVITEFRTGKRGAELTQSLSKVGYLHQHWTIGEDGKNAVMIASRVPFEPVEFALPDSEFHRLAGARFADLQVWAVYMAMGKEKLPLYAFLRTITPRSTVLIGDFNTGLHRLDEQGAAFAATNEFAELQTSGWIDAWRLQHGQDVREFSWMSRVGNGFRIDHALVSDDLIDCVADCRYDHATRPRLTDHSALILEVAWRG